MSYDGSGTYDLPSEATVVTNTAISSSAHNTTMTDIGTALTACMVKDGQSVFSGALKLFPPYGAEEVGGMKLDSGLVNANLDAYLQSEIDDTISFGIGVEGFFIARVDHLEISAFTGLGAKSELTIATGAITATKSYHSVDTEADASSDDLDTINGAASGRMLVIEANNSARSVVAKDGTGNLLLAGDFTMDHADDKLTLCGEGTDWVEISRSSNA